MIVYMETETLARELGFSAKTLYSISNSLDRHYRAVSIPKSNGGVRRLQVPDEVLKSVQRAIAERLLAYEPISPYATAYRITGGIRKNALPHVGKEKLLKLDIAHFFDSIRYSSVKDFAFPAARYSEANRILLSMLCYYREALPQGAPTSPIISNIILRSFDETVGAWCAERGISYTRYCDDMAFSGSFDEKAVISLVRTELGRLGLFLNPKKTVVATSAERQTVTGLVVNTNPHPSKEYLREIRSEVYFCKKYGVEGHLLRTASPMSRCEYLRHLLGKINYVLQYLPADAHFLAYREEVLRMMKAEHAEEK